jgi:hypothetical protein
LCFQTPVPHILGIDWQVSFVNLQTCVHSVCTIFTLPCLSLNPLPTTSTELPRRSFSSLLSFNFVNEIKWNLCLQRDFPCDSRLVCIIKWIGSCPLFFWFFV